MAFAFERCAENPIVRRPRSEPGLILPTGAVVTDVLMYLYYGVCDMAIALAPAPPADVVDAVPGR